MPGVSDITYQGQRDYSIRCWLDPQKMAACNITAVDVANAIRNQNLDAPAGWIGQPPTTAGQAFELPINTLGRLNTPEQFGDIIVKAGMSAPPPSSAHGHGGAAQGNFGLPNGAAGSGVRRLRPAATTGGGTASDSTSDSPATGDRQRRHRQRRDRGRRRHHGRRRDHGRRRNLGRRRLDRRRRNDGRRGDRRTGPRPPPSGSATA